ncbi:MAG TPA: UDP-N-acetylmuramate dehydrogenase [Candidatus Staskawiczbacteria bacterium]|nr:UDP-N-acetylmuramate dehydrogenase [Candidatus Staskawiczbacteria bacterium]
MKDIVFEKNVSLKEYTTFKVGGPAKYFFIARDKMSLEGAVAAAKEKKLPVFIFGGGSNLLVSDKGFRGLVIKNEIKEIEFLEDKVLVGSGYVLSKFASEASKKGFSGFEWAIGIPSATVGGAAYGNAQAFGSRTSDLINEVEVFDLKTLKLKKLSKSQCKFSLKSSIFKKNKDLVIVSVVFDLKRGNGEEIKENAARFLKHRKHSHPLEFPSAGSVFVNPEIKIKNKRLLKDYPELNELNKNQAIPSGYLIENAGLKGKKIGKAQISEKHANFIINLGGAKAKDIVALMNLAQKRVKEVFNVKLETEIQRIGF